MRSDVNAPNFCFLINFLLGGVVHFRGIHGVCIYMKYLLRQESARDYVDGILSFSKQPKVFISDIPSQVS